MNFKVLNFNDINNSNYVFGFGCFDEYLSVTKEFINRGLYGELNPDLEKFKTPNCIDIIDRQFISHIILEINIIHNQLLVDINLLPNVNGLALKDSIDNDLDVSLLPRLVVYESLDLKNNKIRIIKSKIITFDVFVK